MRRNPAAQPERHVAQSLHCVHASPAGAMLLYLISVSNRYWKMRCPLLAGAKLFYLSGMKNGRYMKREVLNLARFISVMKFRPLSWRQTHPFLLADRFEVGGWCLLLKCGSRYLLCLHACPSRARPAPASSRRHVDGAGLVSLGPLIAV